MPSLRRLPQSWIITGLFLVGLLVLLLVYRAYLAAHPHPQTPSELAEVLRQFRPALHVIPADSSGPENGIYICERPRSRDEILGLLRRPDCAERLAGVVYCVGAERAREMTPEECIGLSTCCNHVVLTEHLILYGDPRLLADLALLYGYEESFYVRDSAVEGIVDELLADLARALGAKGSRR